jgi:hypothetical protein
MKKFQLAHLSAIFIIFSLVLAQQSSSRAEAAGFCAAGPNRPGFSVGSQTRGSVVTLCGKYTADHAEPVANVSKPIAGAPTVRTKPAPLTKPRAVDPKTAVRLLHRRLARQGESSFSPTKLVILARPGSVTPRQIVKVHVAHQNQFRTAYLLSRFVSLRFTPLKIDLSFDAKAHTVHNAPANFEASVFFKTPGFHTVHGIVTYRAEYRLSGAKTWQSISGQVQLAAIAAKIFVTSSKVKPSQPGGFANKALLVANDCSKNGALAGCLN